MSDALKEFLKTPDRPSGLPLWGPRPPVDGELLAVISIDLTFALLPNAVADLAAAGTRCGGYTRFQLEDSRSWEFFCYEAALRFQRLVPDTKDLWEVNDFPSAVGAYVSALVTCLDRHRGWMDTEYWTMYGTENIADLVAKEFGSIDQVIQTCLGFSPHRSVQKFDLRKNEDNGN